ncbi:aldehyde dehydrogenase [Maritimibacter sp. DP1N21-5]|uniref:aldehyde dehydrogenase family protein n=1 Tax=Maritimibacter sp. DP1N21-5 TaxID=2836867 RepID=UPI001C45A0F8|nr:aldehyde dehydrogenase family protein [Maritimibacter sp. DP1N21-5]MBV7408542.1 aldehyde dehydrogenase family protein [Maritimibacter sp. DP1N21-5]
MNTVASPAPLQTTTFLNWIGNKDMPAASGKTFDHISPIDGSVVARFADSGEEDARRAVELARKTFDSGVWSNAPARSRFEVLRRVARIIEDNKQELAERMVLESGKPVSTAMGEIMGAVKTFEYYAGATLDLEGSAISDRNPQAFGLILREPVGVAAFITPWNFPLLNPVCKIAPALAAGCVVVAKPSHLCSSPTVLLARYLAQAGVPDGVVSVITSQKDRGAVVGQYLSSSPLVDKVAFTGSTATGRAVMRAAATNNKKVALELGGKSANIVFEDADLDTAAATAIAAFCYNSGQQCSAGTRLLVQRSIYDDFMERVLAQAGKQIVGDPRDAATTMGPLVNREQYDRVRGHVNVGHDCGTLLTGGSRPDDSRLDDGLYLMPTIFGGVDNQSRLAQEEVFGPILAVIPFDDTDAAIRLANDSAYGLAGGVWTRNLDRAFKVIKGVRTGKMFVNGYNNVGIDDMPHGGYKDSGVGREFGREGLAEYQQVKTVQIKLA